MSKRFISADELLSDSFLLAERIFSAGYRPDWIVGIWRGGTPVAIAVHEYFSFKGVQSNHIAIKTSSYTGIDQQEPQVTIDGLEYLIENTAADKNVLLVDDVFDTGRSVEAIKKCLREKMQADTPVLKVATPWFKPTRNLTDERPDYFLHESDDWLVFPHELCGLSADELASKNLGNL